MRAFLKQAILAAVAFTVIAQPAQAQFSDSYNFLKAVRERKGADVEAALSSPGTVIVNTRDSTTGETALHIVVQRRDSEWLSYLLVKGANPNLADKKGVTPLMLATQLGFAEAIDLMLDKGAKIKANVDATNRSGETALITAVHLRNPEIVRLLLKAGANPDKKDSVAGLSAREYAAQDGRANAISNIIDSVSKPAATKASKDLDFSGIGEVKKPTEKK
jgi:uncharacterized protein